VRPLSAFVVGGALAFAFAPWHLWLLAPLSLLALHCCLPGDEERRFGSPASEALSGLCYGAGLALCGCRWLYLALYEGGHNTAYAVLLAGMVMLLFALHYAAAFALSAWLAGQCGRAAFACYCLLFFPACWVLAEWLRRALIYDFPWFILGESQVPGALLTGFAPVGGVLMLSWLLALCAGAAAVLLREGRRPAALRVCCVVLAACLVGDAILRQQQWSVPEQRPVPVTVIQTMRPVGEKWRGGEAMATAHRLEDIVDQEAGRLVVTPETMLETPAFIMPDAFWDRLHAVLERRHSYLLLGIPTAEKAGAGLHIYNSVLSLGPSGFDLYRKQHLVPVAEHLPFKESLAGFYHALLSYPLQDQAFGEPEWSRPLYASGYLFAPLICYDAAYGEPAARQAIDSGALVNVSDDSWIDDEAYFAQNEQMAQARALETQRPLLRSNNVGHTSVIGPDGAIRASAPSRREAFLRFDLELRKGSTPYMRFGDAPLLFWTVATALAGAVCRLLRWYRACRSPTLAAF
jgi:apolipoprotein N-acyltransferase